MQVFATTTSPNRPDPPGVTDVAARPADGPSRRRREARAVCRHLRPPGTPDRVAPGGAHIDQLEAQP